ncbi:hypothetical protein INT44_004564 [Umbelopsis vinacea]|uniref:PAS domain-containing protein n=1 Tax=Umbelopsis vinacea TaxID=44442 RepID=A0A8H7QB60_9FUNG|nr:hypothetical protein INT44_004564 [Umbelopsis vinacea]
MREPVNSSNVALADPFEPITLNASQLPPSNPHLFLENDFTSASCTFPQQSTSYQTTNFVPSLANSNIMPPIGPLPSTKSDHQMSGMYSSSGFDMLSVLARLANRPNPQIDLGPVDLSCSFVVADARQYDTPIIYVSPMFERMTLYSASEAMGLNCRFLQAPDGHVAKGTLRSYTEDTSVLHIKQHMIQGKESQASLVNYKKGGQPFVNLVTVIPITWDNDEIAYFVGLQVDMVRQPESILERMRNGTYVANYHTITIPPTIPTTTPITESQDAGDGPLEYYRPDIIVPSNQIPTPNHYNQFDTPIQQKEIPQIQPVNMIKESPSSRATKRQRTTHGIIDILLTKKAETESLKRQWNQVVLENTNAFVHVLSLKGIFLYCSRATNKILEYDPSELLGTSISQLIHPSDVIPVMRDLKESSNSKVPINLIYRIKRKISGYMWIECHGRLDLEQGKGRKCVILSGRERPVYELGRQRISTAITSSEHQNFGDNEFWGKLSVDGLFLYVTSSSERAVGVKSEDFNGLSIFQVTRHEEAADIADALQQVRTGETVNIRHHIRINENEETFVDTCFYPGNTAQERDSPAFILIRVVNSEAEPADSLTVANKIEPLETDIGCGFDSDYEEADNEEGHESDHSGDSGSTSEESIGIPDATITENLFNELETSRNTSWQFEMHQMRLINKRLREKIHRLSKRSTL